MARGSQYPMGSCPTPGLVWIVGSFQVDTTNDPDSSEYAGKGFSVEHTDVGKYTVTLDRAIRRPIAIWTDCGLSGDDKEYQTHHGTIDETAALSSFIIYTTVGATDTDTDDMRVSFCVIGSDTTAPK